MLWSVFTGKACFSGGNRTSNVIFVIGNDVSHKSDTPEAGPASITISGFVFHICVDFIFHHRSAEMANWLSELLDLSSSP